MGHSLPYPTANTTGAGMSLEAAHCVHGLWNIPVPPCHVGKTESAIHLR